VCVCVLAVNYYSLALLHSAYLSKLKINWLIIKPKIADMITTPAHKWRRLLRSGRKRKCLQFYLSGMQWPPDAGLIGPKSKSRPGLKNHYFAVWSDTVARPVSATRVIFLYRDPDFV